MHLFASTDGPDTDFTAKLVDVYPDGKAWNVCDGIIRARYRNGRGPAELLTPGEVYEFEIDLLGDVQRVQGRAPHPGRDQQQQLPALRSQPQHRQTDRRRRPTRASPKTASTTTPITLTHPAASHSIDTDLTSRNVVPAPWPASVSELTG